MRVEIAYVDARLDAWASWVRGNENAWARRTLLGRIIDEGVSGASQEAPLVNMPESVGETDRAVARIARDLKQVIKIYYLTHAASEVKAARCHCSRRTFWRRVEQGQLAVNCELELLTHGTAKSRFSAYSHVLSLAIPA